MTMENMAKNLPMGLTVLTLMTSCGKNRRIHSWTLWEIPAIPPSLRDLIMTLMRKGAFCGHQEEEANV